ncbi:MULTISPECIES: sigma factor-like helix-turn-helix DNA-binding protein [unclassified Corallococcus]|uniref:sigma factor-like helix-turn-helix DNA-binding protein n=1 Tax=unclassified Corallococcus TaxID=2685029 RepID=UPI001A8EB3BF|nr:MULTISPECIES: sigma factor-like helix-turn-helix DNA-binding protein [unclassified Corallococcus]MBN9686859.1 RNA polymerase subunit sigma-70 [Corallococcus sp. NCSPR001]WAS89306.1 sigma factor-like helix-turn-helix DNA-binding protein [Corallococcus sp. NCRR]
MLASILERCAAAWPGLQLEPGPFVAHLGRHTASGEPLAQALSALHCEDLYLALAALDGQRAALDALESAVLVPAGRAVRRVENSDAFVDEVLQLTRLRLLVEEGGRAPRLTEYAGRGPLRRWTEAVALGIALALKRKPERSTPLDDALIAADLGAADPELEHIRHRYRPAFRAAFVEALASLSPRDRNLLRMGLVQGLGVESLGALHQVHASTVSRWMAKAREALLVHTRQGLARRLALNTSQLDSLLRVLDGSLELSLASLLKEG